MPPTKFPGVHFLDATTQEEAATPLRLILIFSCPVGSPAALHGMHLLGTAGDTNLAQIESLVKVSELELRIDILPKVPHNLINLWCRISRKEKSMWCRCTPH